MKFIFFFSLITKSPFEWKLTRVSLGVRLKYTFYTLVRCQLSYYCLYSYSIYKEYYFSKT